MNSNFENNEDTQQSYPRQLNNPRIIEIPVQHYTTPIAPAAHHTANPSTTAAPLNTDHYKNSNDFFNRPGIFDDLQSPFGNAFFFI